MSRLKYFTDDEVYILHRQSIEGSYNIIMSDDYNEEERNLHSHLMEELLYERINRDIAKGEKNEK